MYQLFNYWFGWDYIQWSNTADEGISKVRVAESGEVFYWRYSFTSVLDKINDPKDVIWLTCKPEKYFSSQN